MKRNILSVTIGTTLLLVTSCTDILDEQPRATLTPDLFTTERGINSGITAAYNGLRYISGAQASQFSTQFGTDEFTGGEGTPNHILDMTTGTNPISASTGDISTYWNNLFPFINTCNGIIEYGTKAGISEGLIAEAHFLRAYFYFQQVQMFGGVPLDLGSGELKFNVSQSNISHRNTVDEVYSAIFSDLTYAVEHLPITPVMVGRAFKATAIHFLAKAYLTHGDYQLALNEAEKLLNPTNPYTTNTYGVALLNSYADVIRATNEHNVEVLFTCEHTNSAYEFNETAAGYGSGPAGKDDRSLSYYTPNYPSRFQLTDGAGGILLRSLEYSRPWMRFVSTYRLRQQIFADKVNDSRYRSSFLTVYLNNNKPVTGRLGQPLLVGDTAFVFADNEVSEAYKATKNYRIYNPSEITRAIFPGMKKFYDPNRKDVNDASGRPFILAKLSETYLIAAEAILKGATSTQGNTARSLLLVLRRRAAFPGHEQAMIDATPATIDIDYILDERSRELCGEQHRWFDLKRTGKWRERSNSYSINGIETFNRNILSHYDLRPIPLNQIDLMGNSKAEKEAYQNPGY